jgi:hypothetical protein
MRYHNVVIRKCQDQESYLLDFHLACAAFIAISLRFLAERAFFLAGPPFNPPNRPKATAAGFFLWGFVAGSSVAAFNISKAVTFSSLGFLDRLGIPQYATSNRMIQ